MMARFLFRKNCFAFPQRGARLLARNAFAAIQLLQSPADLVVNSQAMRLQPSLLVWRLELTISFSLVSPALARIESVLVDDPRSGPLSRLFVADPSLAAHLRK
jgi:hypothetical protein